MLRRSYLLAAARAAGVPSLWLDDAVQDITIRLWQAGPDAPQKAVVRYAAIDAVRHYRGDRRYPTRPEHMPIDAAYKLHDQLDRYGYIDDFDQARRNAPALGRRQRAALELELSGQRPAPETLELHYKHVSDARRRMRM